MLGFLFINFIFSNELQKYIRNVEINIIGLHFL